MRHFGFLVLFLAARAAAAAAPSPLEALEREVTRIAARATPAVVQISPTTVYGGGFLGGGYSGPWPSPPGWFGNPYQTASTTGFLWDAAGRVVMAGLPSGTGDGRITLADGRQMTGYHGGFDPETGLRLARIPPTAVSPLPIGDSRALRPGAALIVIAAAEGFRPGPYPCTLSSVEEGASPRLRLSSIPGNSASGAPVLNRRGELVAVVVSAGTTYAAGSAGVAVPIHAARAAIERMAAAPPPGYLGVSADEMSPEQANRVGVQPDDGLLVVEVLADTPAAAAGIARDDVIIAVAGKDVRHPADLRAALAAAAPGTRVKIALLRQGRRLVVTVTTAPVPLFQPAF